MKINFTKKEELHNGLYTSNNLAPNTWEFVNGVWTQHVKDTSEGEGMISRHNHPDLTEIILYKADSNYAGILRKSKHQRGEYHLAIIKPGEYHGDDTTPSKGSFVSIKTPLIPIAVSSQMNEGVPDVEICFNKRKKIINRNKKRLSWLRKYYFRNRFYKRSFS
jgi:hypothetical protein